MHKHKPLTVRPLRFRHCWTITRQPNVPAVRGHLAFSHLKLARRFHSYRALGPSAAVFCGPVLLAIGGMIVQQPGVGEAWSVHGAAIGRLHLGFALVRLARRQLARVMVSCKLHRVQATCSEWPDKKELRRFGGFIRLLGFEYETRLRRADALGQDVLVFSILTDQGRAA